MSIWFRSLQLRGKGGSGEVCQCSSFVSLPSFVTRKRVWSVLLMQVKQNLSGWFGSCCRQIPGWIGSEGSWVNLGNCNFCITHKPVRSPFIILMEPRQKQTNKQILWLNILNTSVGERPWKQLGFPQPVYSARISVTPACFLWQEEQLLLLRPVLPPYAVGVWGGLHSRNSSALSDKPWKQIANYRQHFGRKAVIPLFTLGPQATSAGLWEWKTTPCYQLNIFGEKSGQGKEGLCPKSLIPTITKVPLTGPRARAILVAFSHHSPDCKSGLKWINCLLYLHIANCINCPWLIEFLSAHFSARKSISPFNQVQLRQPSLLIVVFPEDIFPRDFLANTSGCFFQGLHWPAGTDIHLSSAASPC